MIYIRADANKQIASGHIMRCMSIADAIRRQGADVTFITADYEGEELLKSNHYKAICLNSKWDNLESELESLIEVIRKYQIKIILIDSYYITKNYILKLNEYIKVAVIDDFNNFCYPCSMLINYAIYADQQFYCKYYDQNTNVLLGCKYAPLRRNFMNMPVKQINKPINEILITTGGSDNFNLVGKLLLKLLHTKVIANKKISAVVGIYNKNLADLRHISEQNDNVHILCNINNIEQYMQKADLIISAGGSTLYEICSVGTPAISYSFADNQLKNVLKFNDEQLIAYAGDIRADDVIQRIIKLIEYYEVEYMVRKENVKSMQNLIDGNGADRIATEILMMQ